MALLKSEDYLDDADPGGVTCPCGADGSNVAVGFAQRSGSEEIRWVYLGLRCLSDGVLGGCADWKIDYSPSTHLYQAV